MSKAKKLLPISDAEEDAINRGAASDPDAPELTDSQLARMRPASEMLPKIFGQENAEKLIRRRGRPALPVTKVAVNVRYDRDLLEAFKAKGDGWQTLMNSALREWAAEHGILKRN